MAFLSRLGLVLAGLALLGLSQVAPVSADPVIGELPAADRRPAGAAVSSPKSVLFPSAPAVVSAAPPSEQRAERTRGEGLASMALQYVGTPYRWGGTSPAGFDCSGFVMFLYAKVGVDLPRDQQGQLASGRRVEPGALIPGDVLVFQNTYRPGPSHSGIYVGDRRFVHAADERHGVTVSSLGDSYWAPRLYGASRPGR